MPVKIVDKKTNLGIFFHPFQYFHDFFVCKMMTEQGTEDNVWFFLKLQQLIIGGVKFNAFILLS